MMIMVSMCHLCHGYVGEPNSLATANVPAGARYPTNRTMTPTCPPASPADATAKAANYSRRALH